MPRSLTVRLVMTAVALVAVVCLLVGTVATLLLHRQLTERLDDDISDATRRAAVELVGAAPRDVRGQQVGTLTQVFTDGLDAGWVIVQGQRGPAQRQLLSGEATAALGQLEDDDRPHELEVPGFGDYRVLTANINGATLIVGLPTEDVDDAVGNLATWFTLLALAGVGVAAVAGAWLVRRQLRPLHAVAETARSVSGQRLDTGEATIDTRVPVQHTDPGTEVGQVGAALNTLLDHVEDALSARHRSEQQVRQFVADASHELRTPLATIAGYAELSRRTPDDAAALLGALGKVQTESGRMSALVEDLLVLARLDAGRPLAQEPVDLTRLLLEAVTDARVVAPDHTWRLELPEEPVTVLGDAARLHQVVTNLLANARVHTPPGTTITVRARDGVFQVHDDGPGLPEDLVPRAFERFTRADTSRTRASGGTGLGLSLVAAIAHAHGGRAEVRSQPGDTTFEVSLPVAPS